MITSQQLREVETQTANEVGSIEALRQILTTQEQREIGHDEAQEVGISLIEFYQLLAEEVQDDPTS